MTPQRRARLDRTKAALFCMYVTASVIVAGFIEGSAH